MDQWIAAVLVVGMALTGCFRGTPGETPHDCEYDGQEDDPGASARNGSDVEVGNLTDAWLADHEYFRGAFRPGEDPAMDGEVPCDVGVQEMDDLRETGATVRSRPDEIPRDAWVRYRNVTYHVALTFAVSN